MLHSMTAFGQAVFETNHGDYLWQVRSVNHRHLDATMRLPEDMRFLEIAVRDRLSTQLHRGKVEITLKPVAESAGVHSTPGIAANYKLVVNDSLLQQLSEAIDHVQSVRIDAGRCDPLAMLQWPGIVSTQTSLDADLPRVALDGFDHALTDFMASRQREGKAIADALIARAQSFDALLAGLRHSRPEIIKAQRQKLLSKLSQLDVEHDPGRLEQELVYVAQRLDIDEELDRLAAHLIELAQVFKRCEPVGRRLDFLMQELNREVNTIASKASDSKTTSISIDMKVLIEQMREQIQNIE